MASVDDRIVRMEFDNAEFERKLGSTLTSLGQLDKALKFEGAQQGLSGVQGAIDKFNLGNIGTHIESASAKFLALGSIAFSVLNNITNKAMAAGTQMAKSLVLDGITQGFGEFELKMGSIQTIMAGSGESLDVVNKKLQELNEYSDKTIYSFKDMTSNIGKFTNAGIDLDTSVASIQGIANVAAISGANAEEASRAMYNFAQALSKGNVQLIDWKSIEMANMATKEFKDQLIESAVASGTLTKRGDEFVTSTGKVVTATKGFNDSLTDGWLTTEALNATLGRYSDETTDIGKRATAAAQDIKTFTQMMSTLKETTGSGWAQSFEVIFGNFEEGKQLWTAVGGFIGDFVNKNADARNKLLQGWKDQGGRNMLIMSLGTAAKNIFEALAPIKEAFQDIFPPMTVDRLVKLTQQFAYFAQSLKPSEQTVENLGRIFKGVFAVLEIGWEVIKQTAKFFGTLIDAIAGASSGSFLAFLARIGDFFVGLNKMLVEGEGIQRFFELLGGVIAIPIALIGDLKDGILNFFGVVSQSDAIDKTGETFGRLGDRLEVLKDVFKKILGLWDPLLEFATKIKGVFDQVFDAVMDVVSDLASKLGTALKSGEFSAILDALNVGLFGGLLLVMNKFINKGIKINATLQTFFSGGVFEKIGKSFDQLTATLGAMQAKLKAEALMKIATAIGILTASVLVLSLIDSESLTKALVAMSVGFGQLMGAFAIIMKMSVGPKSAASFDLIAAGMVVLSSAILILAGAMAIMGTMEPEQIAAGVLGLSAMLGVLIVAIKPMSTMAPQMLLAGTGLVAISVALTVLAGAVKLFSMMNWKDTAEGFIGLGVGLGIIAVAMKLMPMSAILTGPALLAIAVAMNILAGAIKIFATMSWAEIGRGLATLAGALVAIGVAMNLMPTNMVLTAPALIAVAFALNIIAGAMKIMATMDWGDIGRGLTVMAGALIILAVACQAMQGAIPGAIAIGIAAGSLLVLAMVLKAFAAISWGELLQGLGGIALALAALGLVAYALQPAIGAMIGLGAALVLIGGGFALFGLGADMVTRALERFVELGPKAGEALVNFMKALGKGLPAIMTGLAEGLMEMLNVFAEGIPEMVAIIIKLLDQLLSGLQTLIPKALLIVGEFVEGIIYMLGFQYVPAIIAAGMNIIMSFLKGIRDNIGGIVTVVGDIITNFLDALSVEIPKITNSVANLIVNLFTGVAEAVGKVAGSMLFGIGIAFIDGLMQGITGSAESGPVKWFKDLATNVVAWIGDVLSTLLQTGIDFITGLFGGITEKVAEVIEFFEGLGASIIGWIGNAAELLLQTGKDILQGLWNGITFVWDQLFSWGSTLVDLLRDFFPDPISLLENLGKDIIQGMWNGIKEIWDDLTGWISDAASHLPGFLKGPLGMDSPSKVFAELGEFTIMGFQQGLESEWKNTENWMGGLDPAASVDPSKMGKDMAKASAPTDPLAGVKDGSEDVKGFFKGLGGEIVTAVGDTNDTLYQTGYNLIEGLARGISTRWEPLKNWFSTIPNLFRAAFPQPSNLLYEIGYQAMQGLHQGMMAYFTSVLGWINAAGEYIANNFRASLGISSPSKVTMEIGEQVIAGFTYALDHDTTIEASSDRLGERTAQMFKDAFDSIVDNLGDISEFQPTITPVLDLTEVKAGADLISQYLAASEKMVVATSYDQARTIATSPSNVITAPEETITAAPGVQFEQNIYAPTQLSTSDIYKQTRNQITMAKEELSIP